MEARDKIIEFKSFEDLQQTIIQDETNVVDTLAKRYPVRFIMLDNFDTFRKLSGFLSTRQVKLVDLEDLINEDSDEWITVDMLKNAIYNESHKGSLLITPFSELTRFYNSDKFKGLFNEISLYECKGFPNIRIYIPLIGLENRFTDFLNNFKRIEESAPVWKCNTGRQVVKVFLAKTTDFDIPKGGTVLSDLREWLKFWKTDAPQNKVMCMSKCLYTYNKYAQPDNIFEFKKITNAHDFIVDFLESDISIEYKEEEDKYWKELLKIIVKGGDKIENFTEFIKNYFNKMTFQPSDILELWCESNRTEFDRWLLKSICATHDFRDKPYFALCLDEISSYDSPSKLFITIAKRIFFNSKFTNEEQLQYANERKEYMVSQRELFNELVPPDVQNDINEKIVSKINENNYTKAFSLVSGCFNFERVLFLGWYPNYREKSDFKNLYKCFPDLTNYLEIPKIIFPLEEKRWCIDYFQCYKDAKIKDKITEKISEYISSKNKDKETFYGWYHSFKNEHELLAEVENDKRLKIDKVYWIDGLGAEYFSVIKYFVDSEQSDFSIIKSTIGRADIPSSTELNRFEGDNVVHYLELDKKGHDFEQYKPQQTLIDEIDILKNIIHEIINDNRDNPCTIAIVSDHGMTALSRKVSSKNYNNKTEHEGRFVEVDNKESNDSDYIFHTNEKDNKCYKVALTHASLGKKPTHEVHGGCTPEEVLVPFFILSNKNNRKKNFNIELITKKVKVKNAIVKVEIMPEPSTVNLIIDGQVYNMEKNDTQWSVEIENIDEGKHKVTIIPDKEDNNCEDLEIDFLGTGPESIVDMLNFNN